MKTIDQVLEAIDADFPTSFRLVFGNRHYYFPLLTSGWSQDGRELECRFCQLVPAINPLIKRLQVSSYRRWRLSTLPTLQNFFVVFFLFVFVLKNEFGQCVLET